MRRAAAAAAGATLALAAGISAAYVLTDSATAADPSISCETAVEQLLLANRISAASQSYRKDNPSEYQRVTAYLNGGVRPIGNLTHMGQGLVAVEDTCRGLPDTPTTTDVTTTTDTQPPPTATANVWIDPSGGSCVRSQAKSYVDAEACGTLDAAHNVAQPGDLVLVKGGNYPDQTVRRFKGAPRITVLEESGEQAVFANIFLDNPTSNLELKDLSARYVNVGGIECSQDDCGQRSQNIALTNLDLTTFEITYVDGVTVTGSDVGPAESCNGFGYWHPVIGNSNPASWAPKNVLIKGNAFHDFTEAQSSCVSTECLYIWAADGVMVDGNTFKNCHSTGHIYVTTLNVPSVRTYCRNVTVQNNWFMRKNDGSKNYVHFESDCEGLVIRYNTLSDNSELFLLQPSNGTTPFPAKVIGNYGPRPYPGCGGTNWTFSHNVWGPVPGSDAWKCGPTDVLVAQYDYDSPSNFHLRVGANAIGKGDPADVPATDIDNQVRPIGVVDAGADEVP